MRSKTLRHILLHSASSLSLFVIAAPLQSGVAYADDTQSASKISAKYSRASSKKAEKKTLLHVADKQETRSTSPE
ncbi:hypothetical protein AD953_09220, partial [Acetobacter malorum]